MWQKQVEINRCFNANFKLGDTFIYREVTYKIAGIGHTHVICSNESCFGKDVVFSKKDFLKTIKR